MLQNRFPSDARLKQWLVNMRRDTRKWSPKSHASAVPTLRISVFHRQAGQEEAEGHRCAYHFQISTTLLCKERKEPRHTDQVGIQTE
ncbi:hypothetical protein UPYG_G00209690 [Umbra pygmaea]|uniref:THAP-type domain-containing protein n=1 Tax=Umbra pygmaea TaxID=75934 RepID=A0ABD0WJY8_UMBPY